MMWVHSLQQVYFLPLCDSYSLICILKGCISKKPDDTLIPPFQNPSCWKYHFQNSTYVFTHIQFAFIVNFQMTNHQISGFTTAPLWCWPENMVWSFWYALTDAFCYFFSCWTLGKWGRVSQLLFAVVVRMSPNRIVVNGISRYISHELWYLHVFIPFASFLIIVSNLSVLKSAFRALSTSVPG